VRFYERAGLVTSERLPNGYRMYNSDTIAVLRFIGRAKGLGFSLKEIREILALHLSGAEPCKRVVRMIERNLAVIDQRIAALTALRNQLKAATAKRGKKRSANAICPIIESENAQDLKRPSLPGSWRPRKGGAPAPRCGKR